MLTSEKRLDEAALRRAVSALIKHHDALRMMFKKDDNGRILQYNRGISQTDEDGFSFKTIDLADETARLPNAWKRRKNEYSGQCVWTKDSFVTLDCSDCGMQTI
jgi:hypothetical protein